MQVCGSLMANLTSFREYLTRQPQLFGMQLFIIRIAKITTGRADQHLPCHCHPFLSHPYDFSIHSPAQK
jgi:hypothetical protein